MLPAGGFAVEDGGYVAPGRGAEEIRIAPDSERLQLLAPFAPWDGRDLLDMPLLVRVKGKCTTDHISMAGPWLRYRGHLEHISGNLLMGAVNAFSGKTNEVKNQLTGTYGSVSAVAGAYRAAGIASVIVAEDNYGEGSSREHAAMEPRFLNVRVVLAKSFARIHETNLKKQGMLALTFARPDDCDRIREDDRLSVKGLAAFAPGRPLTVVLTHGDGSAEEFPANHTCNEVQIEWFRAGSALNYNAIKRKQSNGENTDL
jgi:aconitate hydratase